MTKTTSDKHLERILRLQDKAKLRLATVTLPHPKTEEWRKFPFRGWSLKQLDSLVTSSQPPMVHIHSASSLPTDSWEDTLFTRLEESIQSPTASYFYLFNLAYCQSFHCMVLGDSTETVEVISSPSPETEIHIPFFAIVQIPNTKSTCYWHLKTDTSKKDPLYVLSSLALYLESGAQTQMVYRESLSDNTIHFHNNTTILQNDSSFRGFHHASGGFLSKEFWRIQLVGDGSTAQMKGLTALRNREMKDMDFLIQHLGAHQDSDLLYKTAVKDKSHHIFTGNLYIPSSSKKSKANQSNHNLSLSKQARAESIPKLEVFAEDVSTSHGATVGEVSEEQLFYLQSRGLNPTEAKAILVEGFFTELLDLFPVESVREDIRIQLFQKVFH